MKLDRFLEGLRTALPEACHQPGSSIGIRLLVPHPEAASEDHCVREDVLHYWLHRHPNLVVDRVRLEVDGELRKSEEATGLRSRKSASNYPFLSILRFHEALDADVVFARDADNDPDLELELMRTLEAVEAGVAAFGVRNLGGNLGANWVTFRPSHQPFSSTAMATFLREHQDCQYLLDEVYLAERYPSSPDVVTFSGSTRITPCLSEHHDPQQPPAIRRDMAALQEKAALAVGRPVAEDRLHVVTLSTDASHYPEPSAPDELTREEDASMKEYAAAQADLVAKRVDLEAAKALLGSRERQWKGAIEDRKAVPRDAPTATRVVMDTEVTHAKARVAEAKAALRPIEAAIAAAEERVEAAAARDYELRGHQEDWTTLNETRGFLVVPLAEHGLDFDPAGIRYPDDITKDADGAVGDATDKGRRLMGHLKGNSTAPSIRALQDGVRGFMQRRRWLPSRLRGADLLPTVPRCFPLPPLPQTL